MYTSSMFVNYIVLIHLKDKLRMPILNQTFFYHASSQLIGFYLDACHLYDQLLIHSNPEYFTLFSHIRDCQIVCDSC